MMYHRVMKINSKSNGGNEYGQKKIIKTAINVLPIIIVPLVVERKRIKSHPEVQKQLMQRQMGQAIANKATGAKEYLGDKNKNSTTNVN